MHKPLLSQLDGHTVCEFASHVKKSMKLLQKKHLTSAPQCACLDMASHNLQLACVKPRLYHVPCTDIKAVGKSKWNQANKDITQLPHATILQFYTFAIQSVICCRFREWMQIPLTDGHGWVVRDVTLYFLCMTQTCAPVVVRQRERCSCKYK